MDACRMDSDIFSRAYMKRDDDFAKNIGIPTSKLKIMMSNEESWTEDMVWNESLGGHWDGIQFHISKWRVFTYQMVRAKKLASSWVGPAGVPNWGFVQSPPPSWWRIRSKDSKKGLPHGSTLLQLKHRWISSAIDGNLTADQDDTPLTRYVKYYVIQYTRISRTYP